MSFETIEKKLVSLGKEVVAHRGNIIIAKNPKTNKFDRYIDESDRKEKDADYDVRIDRDYYRDVKQINPYLKCYISNGKTFDIIKKDGSIVSNLSYFRMGAVKIKDSNWNILLYTRYSKLQVEIYNDKQKFTFAIDNKHIDEWAFTFYQNDNYIAFNNHEKLALLVKWNGTEFVRVDRREK